MTDSVGLTDLSTVPGITVLALIAIVLQTIGALMRIGAL